MQEVYKKDRLHRHNQQGKERLNKLYEDVFPMLFTESTLQQGKSSYNLFADSLN
jgi:hypothetical protein